MHQQRGSPSFCAEYVTRQTYILFGCVNLLENFTYNALSQGVPKQLYFGLAFGVHGALEPKMGILL